MAPPSSKGEDAPPGGGSPPPPARRESFGPCRGVRRGGARRIKVAIRMPSRDGAPLAGGTVTEVVAGGGETPLPLVPPAGQMLLSCAGSEQGGVLVRPCWHRFPGYFRAGSFTARKPR